MHGHGLQLRAIAFSCSPAHSSDSQLMVWEKQVVAEHFEPPPLNHLNRGKRERRGLSGFEAEE